MSNYHREYLERLRTAKRLVPAEPVVAPYRHPREVERLKDGFVIVGPNEMYTVLRVRQRPEQLEPSR